MKLKNVFALKINYLTIFIVGKIFFYYCSKNNNSRKNSFRILIRHIYIYIFIYLHVDVLFLKVVL